MFLELGTSWRVGQLYAPAALSLGKEPPVPIGWEAMWAPKPVWNTWRRENSCHYRDSNSEPSIVHPVSRFMPRTLCENKNLATGS
jgi:hypothetical protein